ncbi:MAG: GntR family transcriptional regulator [Deltaproteobacteria bacterium]|nr:GntR family transcriptional regulator [Deltaproteobacteria bacterium]
MEIKGLRDSVTENLRARIITGRLAPGQRLNEGELCEMFNVSRSPLREALLILEREDLVVNIPRKGTYVSPMSEENVQRIYQVMDMVEMYALDHLEKEGITQIPEVKSAVDQCTIFEMPPRDDWKDLLAYRKMLASFHSKLVETLQNPVIIAFYKRTSSNLARYQYLQLFKMGSGKGMIKDHKQIIGRIEKGDYKEARDLLKAHIETSFRYKIDALKARGRERGAA